uniref:Uncharacterized protein n=1 Tax=Aegilops tauschii subsp. strangulata TaxID=200361 RepID=A0A453C624_AEGTS
MPHKTFAGLCESRIPSSFSSLLYCSKSPFYPKSPPLFIAWISCLHLLPHRFHLEHMDFSPPLHQFHLQSLFPMDFIHPDHVISCLFDHGGAYHKPIID